MGSPASALFRSMGDGTSAGCGKPFGGGITISEEPPPSVDPQPASKNATVKPAAAQMFKFVFIAKILPLGWRDSSKNKDAYQA
jgi:hypothetical protein